MSAANSQILPQGFGTKGGHLTLDGQNLVSLAGEHGSPLFVFSENRLRANAGGFLRAARQGHARAQVCYASKACSNLNVLRIIREEGLGIEVNSGGELQKALTAGFTPDQIVFNGVAKSAAELECAIEVGIRAINVDSAFELRRIQEISLARGQRASVALRLVPGIAGGATAGIQTGGETSKFGMTAPELREALDLLTSTKSMVEVTGMHLHIGSQVAEMDAFLAGVKFAAEQKQALGEKLGKPLTQVNLGGGYPTEYAHRRAADRRSSNELDHFAAPRKAIEMVGEVAAAAQRWIGTDVDILFEPGRAIVADTAVLLTRIESIRKRGELPWLYLDAGYNLLLDSAAIRWYYHMAVANRMEAAADTAFRLVGPLCDSADCFFDVEGEYLVKSLLQRLPDLSPEQRDILRSEVVRLPSTRTLPAATAPGDLVAIFDVGAYSLEEMFQYCGRLRAGAVMIAGDGRVREIRARDSFDDLVQHERQRAV